MPVRIRYKGERIIGNTVHGTQITLGTDTLYCTRRFEEQDADGSYIRPLAFYLAHKAVIDDKRRFEVEIFGEEDFPVEHQPESSAPATGTTEPPAGPATPNGDVFTCPVCQKQFDTAGKLKGHQMGAKHNG